ncbi:hypothetical protein FFF34_011165 [Inquilinus sp. KBS0705]|nr:hypothetical protein FFF34_011165 [Inquilinus sp. KBS0705]
MDFNNIENETLRQALTALQHKNRHDFESLLAPDATLIHNGEPDDIRQWAAGFFFGDAETRFTAITQTADKGQTIWADLESSIAGKIAVKLIFETDGNKITSLNAGRP